MLTYLVRELASENVVEHDLVWLALHLVLEASGEHAEELVDVLLYPRVDRLLSLSQRKRYTSSTQRGYIACVCH